MKLISSKKKIMIALLLLFCFFYISVNLFLNVKLSNIRRASYEAMGQNNPYSSVISDEDFEKMCYRNDLFLKDNEATALLEEESFSTPIFTIHWFFGAKSFYWYTYEALNGEEVIRGSWNVPIFVTWEFQHGKWVITDFYEAP